MLKFERNKPVTPLYCHWLWHSVTVLCDGTVTCGLDDLEYLLCHLFSERVILSILG